MIEPEFKRYYVHGDLMEDLPENYFCTLCDYHGERAHFQDARHTDNRNQTYTSSLERWGRFSKKRPLRFRRSADAENILADEVARDLAAIKAARSPFYRWLIRQNGRDDIIGDLANDVLSDRRFPTSVKSLEEVRSHIFMARDSSEALVALDEAWDEFKLKGKARRDGISPSLRFSIFKRDRYLCQLCGSSAKDGKLELDHKVPVAKGGTNVAANLWVLCFPCNRGKSDSDL